MKHREEKRKKDKENRQKRRRRREGKDLGQCLSPHWAPHWAGVPGEQVEGLTLLGVSPTVELVCCWLMLCFNKSQNNKLPANFC